VSFVAIAPSSTQLNPQPFLSLPEDKQDKSPWLHQRQPLKSYSLRSKPFKTKSISLLHQFPLRQQPQLLVMPLLFLQTCQIHRRLRKSSTKKQSMER
jgi:hypothetical protein